MIYLIRPPAIAAVEDEAKAARYEARGYERVEAWRFVYWWSIRDYHAYARLRGFVPQERAGGEAYLSQRLFWQRR